MHVCDEERWKQPPFLSTPFHHLTLRNPTPTTTKPNPSTQVYLFDSWTSTNAATGKSKTVKTNLYEDVADADYTVKANFKPLKVCCGLVGWLVGWLVRFVWLCVCGGGMMWMDSVPSASKYKTDACTDCVFPSTTHKNTHVQSVSKARLRNTR